ncbi:MAG: hypothetical protein ACXWQQ_13300 [Pseudobdellovibrio sp.]
MDLFKRLILLIILILPYRIHAQDKSAAAAAAAAEGDDTRKPSGRRIRRQLNLITGLETDEEFLIPQRDVVYRGRGTNFFDIDRIKGTDIFRIRPTKAGSGIVTINDKETGQIYVEIRFDVRDDAVERMMREVQILLADIEGIEFKLINPQGTGAPTILIDGYVLLPKDLVRISQVISNYDGKIKSLVTLSPVARQKIADFITRDVNNPEVKISAVGNFIKLEGQVNTKDEHSRIKNIVKLYLPDIVTEKAPSFGNDSVQIIGRKPPSQDDEFILDLITERPPEDKVEPPPKLIQIVAHFVKFNDAYQKSFNFKFAPAISAQNGSNGVSDQSTVGSTINLLNNLLPKLQWARFHGFAKVLDTASVLVQDKKQGHINRKLSIGNPQVAANGQVVQPTATGVDLNVTPTIKSERSGLIELGNLHVDVGAGSKTEPTSSIFVDTTISVRDRQSAAFAGILRKSSESNYGSPADDSNPIITFNASKDYSRSNSQFVVFVTPIIKSSASTGVDQVKKKFRLRD